MFSYETNSSLNKIVNKLPPVLKPNMNGLTKVQLSIYNNCSTPNLQTPQNNNQNNLGSNSDLTRISFPVVREILIKRSFR